MEKETIGNSLGGWIRPVLCGLKVEARRRTFYLSNSRREDYCLNTNIAAVKVFVIGVTSLDERLYRLRRLDR